MDGTDKSFIDYLFRIVKLKYNNLGSCSSRNN